MDIMTAAERSERMSRIRSKNTRPELMVRRALHALGYRYRLHHRDLPGVPDLTFPRRRKVVFIHGCFWHAHQDCKVANRPKSRRPFWDEKFKRNRTRDAANEQALAEDGWRICVIWECETKNMQKVLCKLRSFLGPARSRISKKAA